LKPPAVRCSMKYYHWASEPVRLRKISYLQSGHPKPNGLWFDVNEDWKGWCEAEQFRPETLRYRHKVTILDASQILFLQSVKDIDSFTRKYERNRFSQINLLQSAKDIDAFTREYGRDLFGDIQQQFGKYIVWGEVAKKYSGIVISPYFHEKSLTNLWYYGWGCASGCVWDTCVIRLGRPCKRTP
jgi:hypothetical protein